jgi:hypothetical protein
MYDVVWGYIGLSFVLESAVAVDDKKDIHSYMANNCTELKHKRFIHEHVICKCCVL